MLDKRLYHHLVAWLGQWPPRRALSVVGSERRTVPGWDGKLHPFIGVGSPGKAIFSVPPSRTSAVRDLTPLPIDDLLAKLPEAIGFGERAPFHGKFRWSTSPAKLPDAGEWVDADDPVVPDWLRVFPGPVLVTRDPVTGAYLAGVGVKRHDGYGNEIAVGTEPEARGQGLARRLVAQAARRILDEGAVPTYLHALDNTPSGRVADGAGFADRGWSFYSLDDAA